MNVLSAGIDDIATETRTAEGWSFFVLPSDVAMEFEHRTKEIAKRHGIPSFHGKKFKVAQANAYREFLLLIRATLASHRPGVATTVLMTPEWKSQYVPFARSLAAQVMKLGGATSPRLQEIVQRLVAPVWLLQRITSSFADSEVQIAIDADEVTREFDDSAEVIRGISVRAAQFLAIAYKGYRQAKFPSAPLLRSPRDIAVLPHKKSGMVQAADTLGNFSNAVLFTKLGDDSKTRQCKARLFQEAFAGCLSDVDYTSLAVRVGDDLRLLTDGALTLTLTCEDEA
ncbi:MAG: hypothetical protein HY369_01610 [Candidatus Aenigmarchaeota archaeon]|nr:hypothetical protein [Candidatus Aenigmarchaeota archaeon]